MIQYNDMLLMITLRNRTGTVRVHNYSDILFIAVFTYVEKSANSLQDSHKYEGQFQDFIFQTSELLTASRRVQSTGGHMDRVPSLDQIDSQKERKQHAILNGRTDGLWCKVLCGVDEHQMP